MVTRFATSSLESVTTAFGAELGRQLIIVCPVTGLIVENGFPPFPGAVGFCLHPIVENALGVLALGQSYRETLTNKQAIGLALACLHKVGKLTLKDTSLLVISRLETTLTGGQVFTLLDFIAKKFIKPTRHYPAIELDRYSDEYTLDAYFKKCVAIENYWGSIDWRNEQLKEQAKLAEAPIFLSGKAESKRLNRDCYEAWLEVAPHLPATTKAAAKPYIKTLASNANEALVGKLVATVLSKAGAEEELLEGTEAVLAAHEFKEIVAKARAEASKMGLYAELDDLLSLPTTTADSQPTETVEATTSEPQPALSFSERRRLRLQGGKV